MLLFVDMYKFEIRWGKRVKDLKRFYPFIIANQKFILFCVRFVQVSRLTGIINQYLKSRIMKKLMLALSTVGVIAFTLTSCGKKKEAPVEKTFQVELAQNQSYTFALPENLRKDVYEFSTQASHYSISTLGKNATGEQIYQYTPALDYMGADQVIVRNDQELEEDHQCGFQDGPHQGGGCFGGQEEDHYVVTINFKIGREISTVTTASK
jgi:hypothetical protein